MQEPLANVAVLAVGNGSPHVSVAQFLIGGRLILVNMEHASAGSLGSAVAHAAFRPDFQPHESGKGERDHCQEGESCLSFSGV